MVRPCVILATGFLLKTWMPVIFNGQEIVSFEYLISDSVALVKIASLAFSKCVLAVINKSFNVNLTQQ